VTQRGSRHNRPVLVELMLFNRLCQVPIKWLKPLEM